MFLACVVTLETSLVLSCLTTSLLLWLHLVRREGTPFPATHSHIHALQQLSGINYFFDRFFFKNGSSDEETLSDVGTLVVTSSRE